MYSLRVPSSFAAIGAGAGLKARLALLLVVLSAALATAGATAPRSEAVEIKKNWWGVNVNFNRQETHDLYVGGAAAAAVLGTIGQPWAAPVSAVAGGDFGLRVVRLLQTGRLRPDQRHLGSSELGHLLPGRLRVSAAL